MRQRFCNYDRSSDVISRLEPFGICKITKASGHAFSIPSFPFTSTRGSITFPPTNPRTSPVNVKIRDGPTFNASFQRERLRIAGQTIPSIKIHISTGVLHFRAPPARPHPFRFRYSMVRSASRVYSPFLPFLPPRPSDPTPFFAPTHPPPVVGFSKRPTLDTLLLAVAGHSCVL